MALCDRTEQDAKANAETEPELSVERHNGLIVDHPSGWQFDIEA